METLWNLHGAAGVQLFKDLNDPERTMPRYYFHVFNDINTHDEEGQELADEAAAYATAIRECRILAAESVREGHLNLEHHIEVHGDRQMIVTVSFSDAVEVIGS